MLQEGNGHKPWGVSKEQMGEKVLKLGSTRGLIMQSPVREQGYC